MISIAAVARLTKMSRDRASILLKDLQYDPRGKAKMYYVDDVAEVFAGRRTL